DTLLEKSLVKLGKQYRFYPFRADSDIQDEKDIIILKMHGSIDWFDITHFDDFNESLRNEPHYVPPPSVIFNYNKKIFQPVKIYLVTLW
ncbi:unnamed protein product, partial [marine sediment metagenome]